MTIKNLIRRNREEVPVRKHEGSEVFSLQHDINRLFDQFFGDSSLAPMRLMDDHLAAFRPRVDVSETDQDIKVTAELPGLDEKDVTVTLDENALTIKGEKKEEHEEKTAQSYHLERSFGSFQRVIPLPSQVETQKVKAVFKKGVLHVTLPKIASEKAKSRKIEIKAE